MEAHAADIITALISATGGVIITLLARSIKEWRDGRKDEADRLAKKLDTLRTQKRYWKNEYDYLRAWILSQSLTEEQLNRMPKPPDQTE